MGTSNILDELEWRGLIAQSTDRDALGGRAGRRPCHRLLGVRPDRAEPARRPPHPAADAAPVPAGWASADRAGGRRDRHDRRSARRRRADPEHRATPSPTGPTAFAVSSSDSSTSTTRRPVRSCENNLTWTERAVGDRVPPRRRQALLGQRDARPGHRAAPTRGRGHLLHRVQLHAVAGQRLRGTATGDTAARCRSAAPISGATSSPASGWCARSQARPCTR